MAPSFVIAETVRRQHVALKAILLRNRKIKLYCLLVLIVLCLSLLFVWTRIRVVQQGYELSRLNKETNELMGKKSRLESDIATLKSPQRLESIARDYFGMRLPKGDEIVLIEP